MRTVIALALVAALLGWWAQTLRADTSDTAGGVGGSLVAGRHGRAEADSGKDSATADQPVDNPDTAADSGDGQRRPSAAAASQALFRAAQSPPTPSKPAAPQPGENFTLVGVVGQQAAPAAFLRDQVDGRTWRVVKGDRLGLWTVTLVTDRCAELKAGRRRQWLCL